MLRQAIFAASLLMSVQAHAEDASQSRPSGIYFDYADLPKGPYGSLGNCNANYSSQKYLVSNERLPANMLLATYTRPADPRRAGDHAEIIRYLFQVFTEGDVFDMTLEYLSGDVNGDTIADADVVKNLKEMCAQVND